MTISISGDGLIDRTAGTDMTGTNTNDDAAAGQIGEYVESVAGATNAPATGQYGDLASISLTAGDWDVSVIGVSKLNGATCSGKLIGLGTVAGNSAVGLTYGDTSAELVPSANANQAITIPPKRVSIASTTTYYLKMLAAYSAGTPQFYGRISARRVR